MVDPCSSFLGTQGTHLCKLMKKNILLMRKTHMRKLQYHCIQGVSEDLVPLAHSCASRWLPHQDDDLVLGVCHSRKSPGQPRLHAKRRC